MTYTKKALQGISIIFVMNTIASLVAYLTRIVLARNLAPVEYGLFYAVFTFVTLFLFLRDFGLGDAAVKFIAEYKVKENYDAVKTIIVAVASSQFLISLLIGTVMFLLSDLLARYYFKEPSSAFLLKMLVLYILFSILFLVLKDIFYGFQNFKAVAFVSFTKNLITLLIILAFFYLGIKNSLTPVFAYVLVCPIIFFIFLPSAMKTFPLFKHKIQNFKPITKKLFYFGLPLMLTSVGGKIIGYLDTIILTYFRSLAEVGIYNVVLPSATMFFYFGGALSVVAFPMVSELWAKKDKKRLSEGLKLMLKYVFVLTMPLLFIVLVFAAFFIQVFFGQEYISGALALQILLVGILLFVVAGVNNSIIIGIGKPKLVTKIVLYSALVNTIANLILIPLFGIEGAAAATSFSYLLILLFSTYEVTKLIRIKFPVMIWSKLALTAIVFTFILNYLKNLLSMFNPWLNLIVTSTIALTIYILLVYTLKLIDIKEIKGQLKLLR